jgi:hypothetical protein
MLGSFAKKVFIEDVAFDIFQFYLLINPLIELNMFQSMAAKKVSIMRNTYCLVQIEFITEFTNVQHVIITQI